MLKYIYSICDKRGRVFWGGGRASTSSHHFGSLFDRVCVCVCACAGARVCVQQRSRHMAPVRSFRVIAVSNYQLVTVYSNLMWLLPLLFQLYTCSGLETKTEGKTEQRVWMTGTNLGFFQFFYFIRCSYWRCFFFSLPPFAISVQKIYFYICNKFIIKNEECEFSLIFWDTCTFARFAIISDPT